MTEIIKIEGPTLYIEASMNGSKNPDVIVRHGVAGPVLAAGTVFVRNKRKQQEWIAEIESQYGKAAGDELRAKVDELTARVITILASGKTPSEPPANLQTCPVSEDRDALWMVCSGLATAPRILDLVVEAAKAMGVVGADRQVQLIYLTMTSRVLDQPVSLAIKGPSAAGKSYPLTQGLKLFPKSAYEEWTGMSDHLLVYDDAPLEHKILVIIEAAGMEGDNASYHIRTLLSEGQVKYKTVVKTEDGLKSKEIVRPGPTGLITTTTKVSLHPENETRMLSFTVTDSPGQTRRVLEALASEERPDFDTTSWHGLQRWIEGGDHRVTIPFAKALACSIPTTAVRLRRDFGTLLNLIRAHVVLHQATRSRDDQGRVIATVDDYAAVRELVADLMAEGVEVSVSRAVRETVEAVRDLRSGSSEPVTVSAVARLLKLDVSAASRRVQTATRKGYLKNEETHDRRPARLVLGEPLPESSELLPPVGLLERVCRFADQTEGVAQEDVATVAVSHQIPLPGEKYEQGDAWEKAPDAA